MPHPGGTPFGSCPCRIYSQSAPARTASALEVLPGVGLLVVVVTYVLLVLLTPEGLMHLWRRGCTSVAGHCDRVPGHTDGHWLGCQHTFVSAAKKRMDEILVGREAV